MHILYLNSEHDACKSIKIIIEYNFFLTEISSSLIILNIYDK